MGLKNGIKFKILQELMQDANSGSSDHAFR